jgi:hypothetical protein
MELFINVNAGNLETAPVVSMTDLTPVTSLPQFVLGDSEPLTIKFTDEGEAPAWAGADGYQLEVALGSLDAGGLLTKTFTRSFTPVTAGWIGRLGLATQELIDAMVFSVGNAVNWSRYPLGARFPGPVPNLGWFWLQIRVTDPSGNVETFALFRQAVLNRVLLNPTEPLGDQYPPARAYEQELEFAAELDWDVSLGAAAFVTLTGDALLNNPTNVTNGLVYIFKTIQDGTGGRVLTFGSAFVWPGGVQPTPSSDPDAVDVYTFFATGGKLLGSMVGNFQP